ncbi:DUF4411 family protein [Levilactobacillus brevis]|uniref:DUF4411 family protein n=1 Tax=Levilactobacillus brevis TaxID=1580 RepID=UPI00339C5F8A
MTSNNDSKNFIIDSNSFIAPFRNYYHMDNFPGYWSWLHEQLTSPKKQLLLPKIVYDELASSQDSLAAWIKRDADQYIFKDYQNEPKMWQHFGEVMTYIQNCGFYKDVSIANWSQTGKADPQLIAIAMTYNCDIVTLEQSAGNLSTRNPMKHEPKIPDVVTAMGVKCVDLNTIEQKFKLII